MDMPLPLIVATGMPERIGRTYGRAAREAIAANLDAYLARFCELGASRTWITALGEQFRVAARCHHPRIAAMLDGVASGAGRSEAEIHALNARTEVIMRLSLGAPDGGCTTLGVAGARTASGHTLVAQNWDWSPAQRETMLVLATRDERGHAVVTLTEAGMLAKAGVNSAGIGVCVNIMASDRDGRLGVPYHVILRAALEEEAFARAGLVTSACPRGASLHVLLGAASDELVGLELAPGELACLWPQHAVLAHANHFEACDAVEDLLLRLDGAAESSRQRAEQARVRLARLAAGGGATERQLASVLRDHGMHPICVHGGDLAAPPLEQETLASVLIDVKARRLSVAPGPPCQTSYCPFALAELFPLA